MNALWKNVGRKTTRVWVRISRGLRGMPCVELLPYAHYEDARPGPASSNAKWMGQWKCRVLLLVLVVHRITEQDEVAALRDAYSNHTSRFKFFSPAKLPPLPPQTPKQWHHPEGQSH
jgi:hypothetical protein